MQRSTSGSSRSRFALTHRDRVLMQEVLYSSGEPDVPLRYATLAMCLDREPDGGVSDVYVGMMLFFFGYLSHVVDEPDSGHESLELEGSPARHAEGIISRRGRRHRERLVQEREHHPRHPHGDDARGILRGGDAGSRREEALVPDRKSQGRERGGARRRRNRDPG